LCKKTVRHVNWTGRMSWIIIDEGSIYGMIDANTQVTIDASG